MQIETILGPAEIARLPARDLSGAVCVVFDVLRATSTILTAFAHGARRVYPALTVEEAQAIRRDRAPGALLGGERGGVRLPGFDLGNSPLEYTEAAVAGRDIVTTTTNGTVALRACAGASEVLAGALLNLDPLAGYLRNRPGAESGRLLLVCAGTGENFAFEDGLTAGALAARLGGTFDDATRAMWLLYEMVKDELPGILWESANGRRLEEIGLGADVEWCARVSVLNVVAGLREGALESLPLASGGDLR